eukprot:6135916-Lingulodinium_polyedra.AAC.1
MALLRAHLAPTVRVAAGAGTLLTRVADDLSIVAVGPTEQGGADGVTAAFALVRQDLQGRAGMRLHPTKTVAIASSPAARR